MPTLPRKKRPGDAINADDFNLLIDAMAGVPAIRGGGGIQVTRSFQDVVIALASLSPDELKPARVFEVQGSDGDLIETVTYSAQPMEEGDGSSVIGASPRYGRMYDSGVAVKTARLGDLCFIVRMPEDDGGRSADLWILTEQLLSRRCSTGSGGLAALTDPKKKKIGLDAVPAGQPTRATTDDGPGTGEGGGTAGSAGAGNSTGAGGGL